MVTEPLEGDSGWAGRTCRLSVIPNYFALVIEFLLFVQLEQFRRGLEVELEHGARDPQTNVTNDDLTLTGKIAWAHLKEFADYYTRLDKLEAEADAYWASKRAT